jgi:hypothetical protein
MTHVQVRRCHNGDVVALQDDIEHGFRYPVAERRFVCMRAD